ncbi:hypothetical protein [Clostridium baratii]|uniref:hypothetical protein n=1 Tax=Clostridium baratii TaxID=1561 RepID=UPI0029435C0E|nr:hypothetical protein [Clostridium baratii]
MKKTIATLLSFMVIATIFTACGKYEPKLSDLGVMYRSKLEKEANGSYPVINIRSVTKDGDNIIVKTESPIEQMLYAYKKFICFTVVDAKGNTSDKNEIKIEEYDQQGEFIVTPKDMKINDVKYIQIGPYQNEKNDDSFIEFEVK